MNRRPFWVLWWVGFVPLFAFCFVGMFADFALSNEHRLTQREAYAWLFTFLVGLASLAARAGHGAGKAKGRR